MRDDAFSPELEGISPEMLPAGFPLDATWSAEDEALEREAEVIEQMAFDGEQPIYTDEEIEGWGVVTVVANFIPGVDQIILEFDPSEGPLPLLTFDHGLEDGSTALMGDGRLMALVRGVTEIKREDVNMIVAEAEDGPRASGLDGEFGQADPAPQGARKRALPLLDNFDPREDVIEVVYDPSAHPDPVITVEDFEDQTGANILLDGETVLRVAGAQGLDPADVRLIARTN